MDLVSSVQKKEEEMKRLNEVSLLLLLLLCGGGHRAGKLSDWMDYFVLPKAIARVLTFPLCPALQPTSLRSTPAIPA